MKKAGLLLLAMLFALATASCRDEDKGRSRSDQPDSISGSATLRVVNDVRYTQQIRFNGRYIGDVAAHSSRSWSVPTGRHTVSAWDSVTGTATHTAEFRAGQVTTIRVFLRSARHAGVLVEDKEAVAIE